MAKIIGQSGTIYEMHECTHPGIYYEMINGEPHFVCDKGSGNFVGEIRGQYETHPICGKCGKILSPFRIKPRNPR